MKFEAWTVEICKRVLDLDEEFWIVTVDWTGVPKELNLILMSFGDMESIINGYV